jgi:acetylglutamate kinase
MQQLTIVKVGGKIVEDLESLKTFLKNFALIAGDKILVHGGGHSATTLAEKLGIEIKMTEGRRITDEEMLKVVTMVYAGLVNKNIVAQLQKLQIDAIGLTGADMNLILSDKRPVKEIDYGFVGDIKNINVPVLLELIKQNYLPVIAPLTHDGNGLLLNTNADTIAAEIAKALTFDYNIRLIYCFEKRGVLLNEADKESLIPNLDFELFREYKIKGIIQGGMIPKLDNAFRAINSGVKEVIITCASDVNTGKGTFIR